MMAAMMLPSVAPMVLAYALLAGSAHQRADRVFVGGYFAAWTAYGLAAYGVFRSWTARTWVRWPGIARARTWQGERSSRRASTSDPIKDVCLRHCRTPVHFLAHGWRDGASARFAWASRTASTASAAAGADARPLQPRRDEPCWMAAIAGVIFAEKVLPHGERLTRVIGVAFVALGLWIAISPGSVPGLTDPGADMGPSMQMEPASYKFPYGHAAAGCVLRGRRAQELLRGG